MGRVFVRSQSRDSRASRGGPLELLTRSALGQCPGQRVFDALLALLDQIAIVSAGDAVHLDLNIAGNGLLRPETAAAMAAKP